MTIPLFNSVVMYLLYLLVIGSPFLYTKNNIKLGILMQQQSNNPINQFIFLNLGINSKAATLKATSTIAIPPTDHCTPSLSTRRAAKNVPKLESPNSTPYTPITLPRYSGL